MDPAGLVDLWHIGHSRKRDEDIIKRRSRKQIGKFGIGKLATSTIAHNLTYISKTKKGIYAVSIDFKQFSSTTTGTEKIIIPIQSISNWKEFASDPNIEHMLTMAKVNLALLELECVNDLRQLF